MSDIQNMSKSIFSGTYKSASHVQGIATDGKFMYFSFTTFLLKTDMSGNPIGSVNGLLGHLGCIAYDSGCIYGSLEYKNDSIGKGILNNLCTDAKIPDAFYIACFDTSKINKMNMDAERDEVLQVVCLKDVCDDYKASGHRFGCSGIDGITCCDYTADERSIFVAYGIYKDTRRSDNDNQIILRLPLDKVRKSLCPLCQSTVKNITGISADEKIFVLTGNTTFGIQNLEYDPYLNKMIAAVYRGEKPQFENYSMFIIDLEKEHTVTGRERRYGKESAVGLNFEYGATGIAALGNGYYYFSHDGKNERGFFTNVHMYRYDKNLGFIKL
ncbi:MAG: hypothetical protein J6K66_00070 [Clostridia bacterium]|nr:hypothetical protein [Clostridia bacterium]